MKEKYKLFVHDMNELTDSSNNAKNPSEGRNP